MRIKLYTLRELKQMNAPYLERNAVCGIPKRDYEKLAKHPQKVIHANHRSYAIEDAPYIILNEYVKEVTYED